MREITYIYHKDDCKHPCKIVRDVINQTIEETFVIHDVPVCIHSFFFSHLLRMLKSFQNSFFLLEVCLTEDIVSILKILVKENSLSLLNFKEHLCRVNFFVLVRMKCKHFFLVFFLQILFVEVSWRYWEQLIKIVRSFAPVFDLVCYRHLVEKLWNLCIWHFHLHLLR